jgi:uncharacterized RDD family membrane protein YckC
VLQLMTNPYAPPQAAVRDIADPSALAVPADRGTRLGAMILDSIIFSAMVYLPVLVTVMVGQGMAAADGAAGSNLILGVGLVGAFIGFAVWCWYTIMYIRASGQSIAKKLLGIRVVRTDGSAASLGRIFWLRNVVNALISVVPLYGLIDALFIFGESRQCLHDKIAGTIVLKV